MTKDIKEIDLSLSAEEKELHYKITSILAEHKYENKGKSNVSLYNRGYYPYIANDDIGLVGIYMQKLGLKSVVDLGCGLGFGMLLLRDKFGVEVGGYELDSELLSKIPKKDKHLFKEKNILDLTKDDIKDYQVIYFYDPIYNTESRKRFIDNLSNIMSEGQYLIFKDAGNFTTTWEIMMEHKDKFKTIYFIKGAFTSVHKFIGNAIH